MYGKNGVVTINIIERETKDRANAKKKEYDAARKQNSFWNHEELDHLYLLGSWGLLLLFESSLFPSLSPFRTWTTLTILLNKSSRARSDTKRPDGRRRRRKRRRRRRRKRKKKKKLGSRRLIREVESR